VDMCALQKAFGPGSVFPYPQPLKMSRPGDEGQRDGGPSLPGRMEARMSRATE
jgi:hypothetical protein